MTKTFKRIVIAGIAFIVLAIGASVLVVTGGCSTNAGNPVEGAKNSTLNAVIDASGIKGEIDAKLRSKGGEIAEQIGIPQSTVDSVVDSLAIEDWKVASLPENASETGTYQVDADGTTAQITTYDDPSVVTVNAYGQSVTMEVPESAQSYLPFLSYLDALN